LTVQNLIQDSFIEKNERILNLLHLEGIFLACQEEPIWQFDANLPKVSPAIRRQINEALQERSKRLLDKLAATVVTPRRELAAAGRPTPPRRRQVMPGDSVGTRAGSVAGTICCVVTDGKMHYLLTAASVLTGRRTTRKGIQVLSPAPSDAGPSKPKVVAKLFRSIVPRPDGRTYTCDAALALIDNLDLFARTVRDVGPIRGVKNADLGQTTTIAGRGYGVTRGVVEGVEVSSRIEYTEGTIQFDGLFACSNTTTRGDLGAPILDSEGYLLGMVLAGIRGERSLTLGIPIQAILKLLGVEVVSGA